VILYGTVADRQIGPDLLVRQAAGRAPQYIQFALSQGIATWRRLDEPGDQARRDCWIDR
jgi:hypothetical protein